MAQDEDLGVFGTIGATAEHQQLDHEADKTVEASHPRILAALISLDHPRKPPPNPRAGLGSRGPLAVKGAAAKETLPPLPGAPSAFDGRPEGSDPTLVISP